jgi:hypothetical protein
MYHNKIVNIFKPNQTYTLNLRASVLYMFVYTLYIFLPDSSFNQNMLFQYVDEWAINIWHVFTFEKERICWRPTCFCFKVVVCWWLRFKIWQVWKLWYVDGWAITILWLLILETYRKTYHESVLFQKVQNWLVEKYRLYVQCVPKKAQHKDFTYFCFKNK